MLVLEPNKNKNLGFELWGELAGRWLGAKKSQKQKKLKPFLFFYQNYQKAFSFFGFLDSLAPSHWPASSPHSSNPRCLFFFGSKTSMFICFFNVFWGLLRFSMVCFFCFFIVFYCFLLVFRRVFKDSVKKPVKT